MKYFISLQAFFFFIMSFIDPVFLFNWCSEAIVSLEKGERPKEERKVPPEVFLQPSFPAEKIIARIQHIVQYAFGGDLSTKVTAQEFALFLERWARYSKNSITFSGKIGVSSRVQRTLFAENLVYSPFKLIEVLRSREPSSLSGVELRSLERSICSIWDAHDNFKGILYSFYLTYLGALLGDRMGKIGAKAKIIHGTNEISVDWDSVPLASPEAITLASRFQMAKKMYTTEVLLQEISQDFSAYNEESKKVISICTLDFLWDRATEVDSLFWRYVTFSSTEDCDSPSFDVHSAMLHRFIKRALVPLDRYWEESLLAKVLDGTDFNSASSFERKKVLLRELIACANLYKYSYAAEVAKHYETGYNLYVAALNTIDCFYPEAQDLTDPEDFSQDLPFVPTMEALDSALPSTIEEIISFALHGSEDWPKAFFSRVFRSEEIAEKLIDSFFNIPLPKEIIRPKQGKSSTSISQEVPVFFKKRVEVEPSKRKKKKNHIMTGPCTTSMRKLSIDPSPPCPKEKTLLTTGEPQLQLSKIVSPIPDKPRSLWVTSKSIEGCESDIVRALGFPPTSTHWHVTKQFIAKAEAAGEIPWVIRCHTYPLLVARLVQNFTAPRVRYSPYRKSFDHSHSCVGSWQEYGQKKPVYLGRFTESFFSEDTVDGKMGMLFHHCFCETTSAACIAQFQKNAAFDSDSDIDEGLENEKENKALPQHPNARFRVTFNPFSITVDDSVGEVLYTLAFSRKISIKQDS